MDSAWKSPNSESIKDAHAAMLKVITDNWKHHVSDCGSEEEKNLVYLAVPGGGSKTKVNRTELPLEFITLPFVWNTVIRRLTLMPKSGDVELQIAPILAAASIASTAWMLFGK